MLWPHVARQALLGIFRLHAKDVSLENILFGDVGMLPPSLATYLSKLVWLNGILQPPESRLDFGQE
jgi:hypothetical protein